MKKPLIGLTPSHNTDNNDIQMRPTYIKALTAAGAIPVVLPLTSSEDDLRKLVDTLDTAFIHRPGRHHLAGYSQPGKE